ncbi:methyltransferase family protein [Nocardia sp. NPDC059177]|uniref:methyltransferase family protein n=1 Tax=Nocardia sp. NPDC059177 TaxID=3346759 RepID=UPI0036C89AC4
MAVAALVLYVIFGALGFGWRSWRHYAATGSSGFKGVSGRLGSMEWLAGAGFVVAIVSGLAGVVLQLTGAVEPVTGLPVQVLGFVLAVAGIAATLFAQNQMGESWRIGVDPAETTTLVRTGVFGLVRNPIFTAMLVFGAGIALIVPNPVALIAFVLLAVTIELQVRVVEEPYLARVHGRAYADYRATTGRFVPRIGLA